MTALFVASDFETGFAKSVFVGRGRRRAAYYLEKLVLCGVLSAVFLLAGMVLTDGAFALAGFEYRASETLGEYWGLGGACVAGRDDVRDGDRCDGAAHA